MCQLLSFHEWLRYRLLKIAIIKECRTIKQTATSVLLVFFLLRYLHFPIAQALYCIASEWEDLHQTVVELGKLWSAYQQNHSFEHSPAGFFELLYQWLCWNKQYHNIINMVGIFANSVNFGLIQSIHEKVTINFIKSSTIPNRFVRRKPETSLNSFWSLESCSPTFRFSISVIDSVVKCTAYPMRKSCAIVSHVQPEQILIKYANPILGNNCNRGYNYCSCGNPCCLYW